MKKKIQITLFLVLFLFITFIVIINFFKGAMITIMNYNEKVFTGSKVCCNADGYYHIGNKGSIVHIDNKGKSNILYNKRENFEYIACNSKYVYAIKDWSLVQFSLNGDIIRRIDTNSDERFHSKITGLYADDKGLFCNEVSMYLLLNSDTLEKMKINDYMNKPKHTSIEDTYVYSDGNISFVSSGVLERVHIKH